MRTEIDIVPGSYSYIHSGIESPAWAWSLEPVAVLSSVHPFSLVGSRKFYKIMGYTSDYPSNQKAQVLTVDSVVLC